MEPKIRVISLGGGVQSTVLTLMAFNGDFGPVPDAVVFADTKWETPATYDHIDWLESQIPVTLTRVDMGRSLLADVRDKTRHGTQGGEGGVDIPLFLKGEEGEKGIGRRQCTTNYKVRPIKRAVRELLGVGRRAYLPAGIAEMWLGISLDEVVRMKPSREAWTKNRWPLIEARMTRTDCRQWFSEYFPGRPLERSACMGCPFQSRRRWAEIKRRWPDHFAALVDVDNGLRDGKLRYNKAAYIHPARIPLSQAVAVDEMQGHLPLGDGFGNECEGHCGV